MGGASASVLAEAKIALLIEAQPIWFDGPVYFILIQGEVMLTCPHCGNQAMSQARKLWLGPASSASCTACGRKVSVSWLAMLAVTPFLAAIFSGHWLLPQHYVVFSLAALAGAALLFAIHAWLIPIIPRAS